MQAMTSTSGPTPFTLEAKIALGILLERYRENRGRT